MRRSKDVRKPIPHPRVPEGDELRAEVRRRCANEFVLDEAYSWPERFWNLFESVGLRRAYAQEYPERFYYTFNFQDDGNRRPSNSRKGYYLFTRPNFMGFLEAHPASAPFDVPDLRDVPYQDRQLVLLRARADWWKENGLPVNDQEAAWYRARLAIERKEPHERTN